MFARSELLASKTESSLASTSPGLAGSPSLLHSTLQSFSSLFILCSSTQRSLSSQFGHDLRRRTGYLLSLVALDRITAQCSSHLPLRVSHSVKRDDHSDSCCHRHSLLPGRLVVALFLAVPRTLSIQRSRQHHTPLTWRARAGSPCIRRWRVGLAILSPRCPDGWIASSPVCVDVNNASLLLCKSPQPYNPHRSVALSLHPKRPRWCLGQRPCSWHSCCFRDTPWLSPMMIQPTSTHINLLRNRLLFCLPR